MYLVVYEYMNRIRMELKDTGASVLHHSCAFVRILGNTRAASSDNSPLGGIVCGRKKAKLKGVAGVGRYLEEGRAKRDIERTGSGPTPPGVSDPPARILYVQSEGGE